MGESWHQPKLYTGFCHAKCKCCFRLLFRVGGLGAALQKKNCAVPFIHKSHISTELWDVYFKARRI